MQIPITMNGRQMHGNEPGRPSLRVVAGRDAEDRAAEQGVYAPAPAPPRNDDERHDWKDRYLRMRSDFENYRRKAASERDRLADVGKEQVLEDVFPIVEHMERAIRCAEGSQDRDGIVQGLRMVHRELMDLLEKHGVERIRTVGERFDPEVHEALAVSAHPDHAENTVVEEVRPGFTRGGRLLRPAAVVVAR